MGLGWRRAFCTSIPREKKSSNIRTNEEPHANPTTPKKRLAGFFSTPSTPPTPSLCSPISNHRTAISNPSSPSPRSPSTLSLLKSTLRISKISRCCICLHNIKTGEGTAIFTAECSHTFHFHCIVSHLKNHSQLICPVCASVWKEIPLLSTHHPECSPADQIKRNISPAFDYTRKQQGRTDLKVYNDDEPLMSPTSLAQFYPIPEFDENGGEESDTGVEEFQGFFVNSGATTIKQKTRNIEIRLLPEAAVVSISRRYETCAVVLTVKAPPALEKSVRRAPIDLVTVLDVGGNMTTLKMQMMKRAMRLLVSSLSAADRLSIVAFAATSKRLLPLRRMTTNGRRSARRIVDALAILETGSSSTGDALKKASKVLEDRREKNPAGSIMLFSSVNDDKSSCHQIRQQLPLVSSTRHAYLDITVHKIRFDRGGACQQAPPADSFAKCARDLLSVVVEDVKLQLGSYPAEIAAVYSCTNRPETLGCNSTRVGDLYADEEREFLVELKLPVSSIASHHVMSVQFCYKDPSTQQIIYNKEVSLLIPRPHGVRSSAPNIQRLRSLFISSRGLAESRRLVERRDLNGAHYMLTSARALLSQSGSASSNEFIGGLEAELKELERKVQQMEKQQKSSIVKGKELVFVDEKGEPLTPTSAWRAAEKLAKVAAMRKSLNKVSDLHGFEDARF